MKDALSSSCRIQRPPPQLLQSPQQQWPTTLAVTTLDITRSSRLNTSAAACCNSKGNWATTTHLTQLQRKRPTGLRKIRTNKARMLTAIDHQYHCYCCWNQGQYKLLQFPPSLLSIVTKTDSILHFRHNPVLLFSGPGAIKTATSSSCSGVTLCCWSGAIVRRGIVHHCVGRLIGCYIFLCYNDLVCCKVATALHNTTSSNTTSFAAVVSPWRGAPLVLAAAAKMAASS